MLGHPKHYLAATWKRLQIVEQAKLQWTRPMFMEVFIVGAGSMWKERNKILFNNITLELESRKRRLIYDLSLLDIGLSRIYTPLF
jgi:hypothetical protein